VLVKVRNPLHAIHEISCLETLAFGCICLVLEMTGGRRNLSTCHQSKLTALFREVCEPGSLIGVVTALWVRWPKNRGSIHAETEVFLFVQWTSDSSPGITRSGVQLTTFCMVPKTGATLRSLTCHSLRGA
jgi:hypothetical protein